MWVRLPPAPPILEKIMKFRLHDFKRNFLVLVIACLLNFAFAFEKLFLVLGCPLSDLVWLIVYGGTALVLTFIAFYDLL